MIDLVYGCCFVFKFLINCEKMCHFIKYVLWKLLDILVHIVIRIVEGYSDDLLIVMTVVQHSDNSDRIASYQRKRHELFRAEHENVQRIVVI